MILEKFLEEKALYDCLNFFNSYFTPTLKERVKDLESYANKLINNAKNYYIASSDNGDLIGFISFYCNNYNSKIAYLTQIAINKNFRKKGIGKKLLNLCIEKCKG